MELRKANELDFARIHSAVCRKNLSYCKHYHIAEDWYKDRLYAVVDGDRVLATLSLVEEPEYGYTAIKRLCILNKKNCGKGIARFALRSVQGLVSGRIGATPWEDNIAMRKLLESEGFELVYKFCENWCFYAKEV